MKDNIYIVILLLVVLALMVVVADIVVKRHERNECLGWQGQSEYLIGYYFADWQKAQCAERGVYIK